MCFFQWSVSCLGCKTLSSVFHPKPGLILVRGSAYALRHLLVLCTTQAPSFDPSSVMFVPCHLYEYVWYVWIGHMRKYTIHCTKCLYCWLVMRSQQFHVTMSGCWSHRWFHVLYGSFWADGQMHIWIICMSELSWHCCMHIIWFHVCDVSILMQYLII